MTTPRRRPAPTFHPVTVADIVQLTPGMRRITLTGEKLAEYPDDGPATHFKLLLPAPGQTEIAVPDRSYPNGYQVDCGDCTYEKQSGALVITVPPAAHPATIVIRP